MRLLILISLLLLASPVFAQPSARPGDFLAWDFLITELPTITRFEVRFGTGGAVDVGIPTPTNDTLTLAGHNTYRRVIPALPVGVVTTGVRTCQGTVCQPETIFDIRIEPPATTARPVNMRVIRPPEE